VGTLWSELASVAAEVVDRPRVYVDANIPAGLVGYMRSTLRWDVLFVIEEPDLRRAPDVEHYRLAGQLRRTLITIDRDYLDDRRFPPAEGAGVVVMSAPDERGLQALLSRLHHDTFRAEQSLVPLPLAGSKLQMFPEPARVAATRRRRRRGGRPPR
jgi:hypothetical protein